MAECPREGFPSARLWNPARATAQGCPCKPLRKSAGFRQRSLNLSAGFSDQESSGLEGTRTLGEIRFGCRGFL